MHGVTEEQEAEHKAWADAHYPVICDCRHAMILNAVLDDFERWFCKSCQRLKIREIPREGWTEPAWSIGANFADHLRNTERIRPIGPAAVHHKCARCDHPFTAKPDGFVDEALENEIAAHRDRCFVVGDYVRWEYGPSQPRNWVDGKLLSLDVKLCQIDVTAAGEDRPLNFQFGPTGLRLGGAMSLRHIPRPSPRPTVLLAEIESTGMTDEGFWQGIAEYTLPGPALNADGNLKHGPGGSGLSGPCDADCRKCAAERPLTTTPVPTPLFDGMTSDACLELWMDNSMIVELGIAPAHAITPAQILEARRRFDDLYATKWSAELRAKLAATAAAERLTVLVDQDPDDIPWR